MTAADYSRDPATRDPARCDECGEDYEPSEGCQHDRDLCAYCLHRCPECLADIKDDYDAEMATDGRWV